MSREVNIAMHRRIKCDRCGAVKESSATVTHNESAFVNGAPGSAVDRFAADASGWETELQLRSCHEGWNGQLTNDTERWLGFSGELCADCIQALADVMSSFFGDGVKGFIGIAKEQEAKTYKSVPVERCHIIHARTNERCIRHDGHSGLHYVSGSGVEFA